MTLPSFLYEEINNNAPHIDQDSFEQALQEVRDASDEDSYPILLVAAAIHEFSNMLNEQITEMYIHALEKERDKKEE